MIIWRGYGFLGALIPFVFILLHNIFLGPETIGWALLTSAVPLWWLGRHYKTQSDENRGDPTITQPITKHDLLWVELDYWAIIIGMLGISLLLKNNFGGVFSTILLLLIPLVFLGRLGYRFYQKYSPEAVNKNESILTKGNTIDDTIKPALTEAEQKKKAFYAQMRKDRETEQKFKTSTHSNYFPGSSSSIPPISEIEEEILFEEE